MEHPRMIQAALEIYDECIRAGETDSEAHLKASAYIAREWMYTHVQAGAMVREALDRDSVRAPPPPVDMRKYRIYGKHSSQQSFRAMDVNSGAQPRSLIHATLLTKEEADLFMSHEAPRNFDWKFEVRPV